MNRPADPPTPTRPGARQEAEHETFFGVPVDELLADPDFIASMGRILKAHGGDPQGWPALNDQFTCDHCKGTGLGREATVCAGDVTLPDGKVVAGCGATDSVFPVGRGLAPDDNTARLNKRAVWGLVKNLLDGVPVMSVTLFRKCYPDINPVLKDGSTLGTLPSYAVCALCHGRPGKAAEDSEGPNPLGDIVHTPSCVWGKLEAWWPAYDNAKEPAS